MAKKNTAKQIGRGLAYIQDTIDVAVSWCFHKLQNTQIPEVAEDTETRKGAAKRAANRVMRFFGDLGESFYKEYDKLKSTRVDKDE